MPNRPTNTLTLTLALLTLAILTIGVSAYRLQVEHLKELHLQDLEVVARLKVDAVRNWLDERRRNLDSASGNPTIANAVADWRGTGSPAAEARLTGFLENFRSAYDFASAELWDIEGQRLLGAGDLMPAMENASTLVRNAVQAGTTVMVDLHYHPQDRSVRFGHLAPLYMRHGDFRFVVGLLFVGLRAEQHLFPTIQQWPQQSDTGELVLVRQEDDRILFLNDLRLVPDTALRMRRQRSEPALPAAVVARTGKPIAIDGFDYRGVEVLAAARPVPGTDWFLVAKMDRSEAMSDINSLGMSTGALVLLTLAATFAIVGTLWQRQQLGAVKARAESDRALHASEARYRAVFQKARIPMLLIDPQDATIVAANHAAEQYYGYGPAQLQQMRITDINTLSADEVAHEMALAEHEQRDMFHFRHRLASGEIRDVEVHSGPLEIDGRQLLYSIVIDITTRKHVERELQSLNRDFVILLENTTDFIYFKDRDSRFRFCSQTLADITGQHSWRDLIGKHDLDVFPPDTARVYCDEEKPIFESGSPLLGRIDPYYDVHGNPGWVSTNKWPVFGDDGKTVIGIFGISRDVSDRIRLEQDLRRMATTDPLTSLPNRRRFLERLEEQLAHIERRSALVSSVMMLDIDHFKQVNDRYGHAAGDTALLHVVALIRKGLRRNDTAGRVGGEEFAILLPGADIEAARISAERLRRAVADSILQLDDARTVRLTVSIGVAEIEDGDKDVDAPLGRADRALYRAKEQGRNRVVTSRDAL